eukprot:SM000207S06191  [mRNA]  locus=s207:217009:221572:- [translate_table: standard]
MGRGRRSFEDGGSGVGFGSREGPGSWERDGVMNGGHRANDPMGLPGRRWDGAPDHHPLVDREPSRRSFGDPETDDRGHARDGNMRKPYGSGGANGEGIMLRPGWAAPDRDGGPGGRGALFSRSNSYGPDRPSPSFERARPGHQQLTRPPYGASNQDNPRHQPAFGDDFADKETFGNGFMTSEERAAMEKKRREEFEKMRKDAQRRSSEPVRVVGQDELQRRKHSIDSLWDQDLSGTSDRPGPQTREPSSLVAASAPSAATVHATRPVVPPGFIKPPGFEETTQPSTEASDVKNVSTISSSVLPMEAMGSGQGIKARDLEDSLFASVAAGERGEDVEKKPKDVEKKPSPAHSNATKEEHRQSAADAGEEQTGHVQVPAKDRAESDGATGSAWSFDKFFGARDLIGTSAPTSREGSILDDLFRGVAGGSNGSHLDSRTLDGHVEENVAADLPLHSPPPKSSKFAQWFSSTEEVAAEAEQEVMPSLLSMLVGEPKRPPGKPSAAVMLQCSKTASRAESVSKPMPQGPSVEDIERGFAASSFVKKAGVLDPLFCAEEDSVLKPSFLSLEDIEQPLLEEASRKGGSEATGMGAWASAAAAMASAPVAVSMQGSDFASKHLLSLLQDGAKHRPPGGNHTLGLGGASASPPGEAFLVAAGTGGLGINARGPQSRTSSSTPSSQSSSAARSSGKLFGDAMKSAGMMTSSKTQQQGAQSEVEDAVSSLTASSQAAVLHDLEADGMDEQVRGERATPFHVAPDALAANPYTPAQHDDYQLSNHSQGSASFEASLAAQHAALFTPTSHPPAPTFPSAHFQHGHQQQQQQSWPAHQDGATFGPPLPFHLPQDAFQHLPPGLEDKPLAQHHLLPLGSMPPNFQGGPGMAPHGFHEGLPHPLFRQQQPSMLYMSPHLPQQELQRQDRVEGKLGEQPWLSGNANISMSQQLVNMRQGLGGFSQQPPLVPLDEPERKLRYG